MRDWRVSVKLTNKELNYLDGALRAEIRNLEESKMGNLPHLIWFTKRLAGKLRRINHKAVRAHMTPEQKRNVTQFLRGAFKEARATK